MIVPRQWRESIRLPICTVLSLGVLAVLFCLTSLSASGATTLSVQAGADSADHGTQVVLFLPGTITVDAGDTVTWTPGAFEAHTVTFGQPPFPPGDNQVFMQFGGSSYDGSIFTHSGLIGPTPWSKGYSLTFTKAGTYNYQCLLHPTMKGSVVVQPAGTAYPPAQASYKAASDPAVATALQAGATAQAAQKVTTRTNTDGSTTYLLNAGVGDGKTFEGMRFGASPLTVHTGDSVTWTQPDLNAIHTITFLDNGKDVPFVIPDAKTIFATNPLGAAPAGGKVYNGTGYVNSGILVPVGSPPQAGPSTYTLTFEKPGTFQYSCLVHDELGMKGTIQVLATLPGLPRTGGAPLGVGLVIAALGLALIGGGVVFRRRQASAGLASDNEPAAG